ncbi:LuxR C-terminal-related transcriptional regulator, partial [Streptomyces sp. NPDC006476]|uniref:helix-turn-helix transcriptional regulator n=1 Tax=Streptomyces sp. NPDC006476 TaxID=3157175 RepID=UPI0033B668E0
MLDESLRMTVAYPACDCGTYSRLQLAMGLTHVREFDLAREILYCRELTGFRDLADGPAELGVARSLLAYTSGDTEAAAMWSRSVLERVRCPGTVAASAHLLLTLIGLRDGDLKSTSLYVQKLRDDVLMGRGGTWAAHIAWAAIRVREARDGPGAAAPFIEELVDFGPISRGVLIGEPAAAAWLVRLALKTGQKALAQQGAAAAQRLAEMNPRTRSLAAAAQHAKALVDHRNSDDLWRAVETHKDPWARASALEDYGVLLQRRRPPEQQIVAVLERSGDAYLAAGAFRDVMRIKNRLWNLGVRHRSARWPTLPGKEIRNLTKTETAVAELVAQGLTNKQVASQLFLSRHTVAFHLRKIFRKLDVASRMEL